MYRALATVAVVAILAFVVLVIWLTHRRRAVRREDLRDLQRKNAALVDLIEDIRREAHANHSAYGTHGPVLDLISTHNRKEPST